MSDTTPELLPCAHCGTEATIDGYQETVYCRKCGIQTAIHPSIQRAIEIWNRRALPEGFALVPDRLTAENGANARLIAAAPELLEALRGMMDAYSDLCSEEEPNYRSYEFRRSRYDAGLAAIKKAAGFPLAAAQEEQDHE